MTAFTAAQLSSRTITVPLTFDHYYSYEQVVEAVKALNEAYPELTRLDLVEKAMKAAKSIAWSSSILKPERKQINLVYMWMAISTGMKSRPGKLPCT